MGSRTKQCPSQSACSCSSEHPLITHEGRGLTREFRPASSPEPLMSQARAKSSPASSTRSTGCPKSVGVSQLSSRHGAELDVSNAQVIEKLPASTGRNGSHDPRSMLWTPCIARVPLLDNPSRSDTAVIWMAGGAQSRGHYSIIDIAHTSSAGNIKLGGPHNLRLRRLQDGTFLLLGSGGGRASASKFSGPTGLADRFAHCATPNQFGYARWPKANDIPGVWFDQSFVDLSIKTFEKTKSFNTDRMTAQVKSAAMLKWSTTGIVKFNDSWLEDDGKGEPTSFALDYHDSVNSDGTPANGALVGFQAGDMRIEGILNAADTAAAIDLFATTRLTVSNGAVVGRPGKGLDLNKSDPREVFTCRAQKHAYKSKLDGTTIGAMPEIILARTFIRDPGLLQDIIDKEIDPIKKMDLVLRFSWNNNQSSDTKKKSKNFLWVALHELAGVMGLQWLPNFDMTRCMIDGAVDTLKFPGFANFKGITFPDQLAESTWQLPFLSPTLSDLLNLVETYPDNASPTMKLSDSLNPNANIVLGTYEKDITGPDPGSPTKKQNCP